MTKALCELMNIGNYPIRIIGTRHGEKKCESLLSREEMASAIDMGNYYKVPPDLRDLNYSKYFNDGDLSKANLEDYNSNNTYQLSVKEIKEKLLELDYIKNQISLWEAR